MIKVKVKKTGKVITVTNNIAHGMIERGEATLYTGKKKSKKKKSKKKKTKDMKPESSKKRYKTK